MNKHFSKEICYLMNGLVSFQRYSTDSIFALFERINGDYLDMLTKMNGNQLRKNNF